MHTWKKSTSLPSAPSRMAPRPFAPPAAAEKFPADGPAPEVEASEPLRPIPIYPPDYEPPRIRIQPADGLPAFPIQCLKIGGKLVRPYGKTGKDLWAKTRIAMKSEGLSPHGAKKEFLKLIKGPGDAGTDEEVIGQFIKLAKAEIQRVEKEKVLPKDERTRGWTRPLKLSRPAWTKEHKEASSSGQDIRHVIRNATIRDALKAEFDVQMKSGKEAALKTFQGIAKHLGLSIEAEHPWDLMEGIYKAAYLNFGNLFPGPSGINRVIGLTADDIYNLGAKWMDVWEGASVQEIEGIFEAVALLISTQSDQTEGQAMQALSQKKISPQGAGEFIRGLEDFFDNITDYLIDMEDTFVQQAEEIQAQPGPYKFGAVWKANVAKEIMDIGANFGFDIPLASVGQEHMGTLIKVEQFLASYKGGDPANLTKVLGEFMKLQSILK
jgi:hypothetical protein